MDARGCGLPVEVEGEWGKQLSCDAHQLDVCHGCAKQPAEQGDYLLDEDRPAVAVGVAVELHRVQVAVVASELLGSGRAREPLYILLSYNRRTDSVSGSR